MIKPISFETNRTYKKNTLGGSMKKLSLILCLVALGACSRKHDDGTPKSAGNFLGSGTTSAGKYGGAIVAPAPGSCLQTCRQTVDVNADVISYPNDDVNVYLCKNTDCSAGVLPSVICATVPVLNQATAACYTSIPSTQIVLGHNVVQFINAERSGWADDAHTILIPGYSSYYINTTITR